MSEQSPMWQPENEEHQLDQEHGEPAENEDRLDWREPGPIFSAGYERCSLSV